MSAAEPQRDALQEGQRESIWSISPGLLWLYISLFGILFVFGTVYLVYYEVTRSSTGNGHDVATAVIKSVGSIAIGAAGISFFATELAGGTMVLASYLKRKLLDEPQRARECALAKLNELAEENAKLRKENARLVEEQARRPAIRRARRRARAQNHDSSNPNQD